MNKIYLIPIFSLIILFFSPNSSFSQDNHSFQWRYRSTTDAPMRNLDVVALPDYGYLSSGLIEIPNTNGILNPYVYRTDCQGKVLWAKQLAEGTEGANNIGGRILPISSTEFILVCNIGFFFSSPKNSIFLAKIDINGNVKWTKKLGGGTQKQTVIQDAIVSADGNILIAGQTGSFGSDSGNNDYTDQYFVKISPAGNIIWSKTYGNPKAIDRSFAITELADNSIVTAGSYLHAGTFYANLLKMDKDGNLLWNKVFGDSIAPHANHAYGVLACKDGGFLITGSTTNAKENFQSYSDMLVIKTNSDGVAQWTRVVAGGAPDLFENSVNSTETENGDYVVMCATSSFPTSGFVGNKYAIITLSSGGSIKNTTTFNQGSSHYPRLLKNKAEGGYMITGFTNWSGYGGDNNTFDPILINTDYKFGVNDCHTNDATSVTSVYNPNFDFKNGPATAGSGGTLTETITNVTDFDLKLNNICEKNGYVSCTNATLPIQEANDLITMTPNPAQVNVPINIKWELDGIETIQVTDIQGKIISEGKVDNWYKNANITLNESGFYFVRLSNSNTQYFKKLVVIQ